MIFFQPRRIAHFVLLAAAGWPILSRAQADETPKAPSPNENPFGTWAYMGAMPTLSKTPYVRGKLVRAAWADLEPTPGDWKWNENNGKRAARAKRQRASAEESESAYGLDDQLKEAADANLNIIVVVFAGSHSPEWIYDQGVPKVKTTGTRGVQSDLYPYYLNEKYQQLFQNMIVKVRDHLAHLPPKIRSHITAVQAGFSSTGDFGPYHGTLVDSRYEIDDAKWLKYYQSMALFYQQQYQDLKPRVRLLFNPSNDPDQSSELIEWLKINCPHSIIKAGNTGHMYQINGERAQMEVLRKQLFAKADEDFLRARSEFGEESRTGGWLEAPAWNMYSLLQAALFTGLDMDCFERGDTVLADKTFFPAFAFFNRYAGQKDPATSPGAWCALRDGLDAADTQRFPESEFGASRLNNQERFLKIAASLSSRGAKQGDPVGGMRNGIRNRALDALNDVGWEIYRGNYEVFLQQIDANATSDGYWRVGPKDQPYGRYARGISSTPEKRTMYFKLDPKFFTGGGSHEATVRVVYFDQGTSHWSLLVHAADGTMKSAAEVTNKDSKRWQEVVIPVNLAALDGKGPRGADLQLQGSGNDPQIFHLIEVQRAQPSLQASLGTAPSAGGE